MVRPISLLLILAACGSNVADEAAARYAYLGLDGAVTRATNLGLQGFNLASNANIDDQTGAGDESGTMVVGGQVDQGVSDNKGLRLDVVLEAYRDAQRDDDDEPILTVYDTVEDAPLQLDVLLRDLPDGTFDGTLVGTVLMSEDLEGEVELDLRVVGELEEADVGVARVEGATRVTGTATSPYGVFDVDLTR